MIAQCRSDVRLEEMQGFVFQGSHHANASIFGEGLVVKRLLGVRGWVAARQSDQARLDRCPPNPSARLRLLDIRGRRPAPPAVSKDGPTETGDIELTVPFSVYKAAMIAAFQSMPSQTHNKGKRLAAKHTDNVTSPLLQKFKSSVS